jgi:flagellin-like protein
VVLVKTRRRAGISELMAAVLTIAITLIAGAALFGFINGEAANSENNLGNANAANVNFLNERFVVTDMSFNNSLDQAYVYLYNNGNVTLNISEIKLYDAAGDSGTGGGNPLYAIFNSSPSTVQPGECGTALSPIVQGSTSTPSIPADSYNTSPIVLTVPNSCLASGTTYHVLIVGFYGSEVEYSACDSPSGVCNS